MQVSRVGVEQIHGGPVNTAPPVTSIMSLLITPVFLTARMLLNLRSTHCSAINAGTHIALAFLYFIKEETGPVVPESNPSRPRPFTEKAEVGPGKGLS